MLKSIYLNSYFLGFMFITATVICKYFHAPKIFLLIIISVPILYQAGINKNNDKKSNFEENLINISKFIIITGILGYVVVRIIGLFFSGFD